MTKANELWALLTMILTAQHSKTNVDTFIVDRICQKTVSIHDSNNLISFIYVVKLINQHSNVIVHWLWRLVSHALLKIPAAPIRNYTTADVRFIHLQLIKIIITIIILIYSHFEKRREWTLVTVTLTLNMLLCRHWKPVRR